MTPLRRTVLKLGLRGADVSELHQRLLEAGETVEPGELRDSFFGPSTRTAVLDFQDTHIDAKKKHLQVDGVVGPITWEALADPHAPIESFITDGWQGDPAAATDHARPAVVAAINEMGVQEDPLGSNRGPRVDLYEGPDWLGSPWCALFVSWCWKMADDGSPFGTLASALKIRDWGAKNSRLLAADAVLMPGDLGVILRAKGRGHVEMVVARCEGVDLSLVGGNVANAVRGTLRPRTQFTAFVRP